MPAPPTPRSDSGPAPGYPGTYRIDRSWEWNLAHGPQWNGPVPDVPPTPAKTLLGLPVRSRIGVAAGLLLGSKWVELYARLGFDVLTYKTVRSAARPCHPLPNWVYVDAKNGVGARDAVLVVADERPVRVANVTSAVCFGMPSVAPEAWRTDVRAARDALSDGQVLIVSVVGTPGDGGEDALVSDYVACARDAEASGAHIVEANLSCPNVSSAEGSIYEDPGLSERLASALRDAIPSTPILLKSGWFDDEAQLGEFARAIAPHVDGVVMVNGIARRVVRKDGAPAFGNVTSVGILGRALHAPALTAARAVARCRDAHSLDLAIVGVGGVMTEHAPTAFFDAGADAVVMGGAPMLDPLLAVRMKRAHPDW
ncbi:MAG: hypothetical protein CMJ84_12145 [Planctomycetes bacterium]|nr:hypothetical protein [Planctomycetota bacterium]